MRRAWLFLVKIFQIISFFVSPPHGGGGEFMCRITLSYARFIAISTAL
jgi:hypothetical protein